MVAHTCSPRTGEAEVEGCCDFKASLSYIVRSDWISSKMLSQNMKPNQEEGTERKKKHKPLSSFFVNEYFPDFYLDKKLWNAYYFYIVMMSNYRSMWNKRV